MQAAKLVGAELVFAYLMSVLALNVRLLLGLPCTNVGAEDVPTVICGGRASTIKTLLESTALGPVFSTAIV